MPPKIKFTREEILAAAVELTREQGLSAVTARAVGERLGASARPIFTAFQNMEELQEEVVRAARALYNQYVAAGLRQTPAFKGVGTQYIRFAAEEPQLFRLLFMSEQAEKPQVDGVLPMIDENYPAIRRSLQTAYDLTAQDADWLYRHIWLYTHGIAAACATHLCRFSAEDISRMLTETFASLLRTIKEEHAHD